MGTCMWRDENIVKTVDNVSDEACKSMECSLKKKQMVSTIKKLEMS